ncbi:uncharacterized protein HD556DRAFT_1305965 [Suillus plorans]|uniref:Uncharacterized protein n=1 Tax=Suillus plorans TaxID=116603 RepID=A0A9P7DMG0_9AGAM|nr:uncharacterized protein HD556DRAFT_1305965 [Suillus plorans]KAG1798503.1 hypothetical protein HD556DRAFT_1305965 [Suillus plorans]
MDVGPVQMSLNRSEPGSLELQDTHCQHISKFAGEIITSAILTGAIITNTIDRNEYSHLVLALHRTSAKNKRVGYMQVNANGILKDASKIEWYHDPDNDMPILPHPESSSEALPPGPHTLDSFIGSHRMPATVVAGSHRSGRPIKPSAKVREAASSAIPAKRSGTTTMPPATKCPLGSSTIGDNDGGGDDDGNGNKDESFVADSGDEEAKEAEEAYQQIKAFGDADRDVRKSLKKDERTADLWMIFTEEKGHKNTHTGESEDGWWCNVCKEANVPLQNCFFKGSISTRRTHIARNPNCHFPIYKSRCEEKGIIMHERAIPLNVKVSDGGQRTLDRALVPKPPQFSKSGLVDYIVELIVAEDEIRKSPQARVFFKKCCTEVDLPTLKLLKWVRTRWASLFKMLEQVIRLRKGVNRFTQLADDSKEVPNLQGKTYSAFKLTQQEWAKLELIRDVLQHYTAQEPANAQQTFSATREPTVWCTIPVLEYLQETWEHMAGTSTFDVLSASVTSGLDNLAKWYCKTNDTDVYFICLVGGQMYTSNIHDPVFLGMFFGYRLAMKDPSGLDKHGPAQELCDQVSHEDDSEDSHTYQVTVKNMFT